MTSKRQAKIITDTFFNALEARDKAKKTGDIKGFEKNDRMVKFINSDNFDMNEKLLGVDIFKEIGSTLEIVKE